ncbi:formate--tetrahydrofolate ligase [Hyphomonas sp.]|uniref:formate--tetrahydrofolate ligase n=1 Tax=Hyphomonas sp. TaxID=87 RepID=UPI00391ABC76
MASDIEIARAARKKPIQEVAARLGVDPEDIIPYGHDKAKLSARYLSGLRSKASGKLVLVTAISPTPAGEGKTTTSIGLADAMNRIGKNTLLCLREPSLGPCFGMKGGATGGGLAQVVPMEDINLHFTGDFHAISAAHNLLAAMVDNHIHWGAEPRIDPVRKTWRRVVDMNDRSLRAIVTGMGGPANGTPAETGFDITAASEVMAVLCLARDPADLEARLGRMIVGYTGNREPVTAADVKAVGAMMALLRDAMLPTLVQTLENNPCLIHGGPFANIAHGCNSVIATRAALRMADYVITEAGFGADLGAEKFLNIKCRQSGLSPDAAVLVATVRALKMHGGLGKDDLGSVSYAALERGLANLGRHMDNLKKFGIPVIVALNRFTTDTSAEINAVQAFCAAQGVQMSLCTHWAEGGRGAEELAHAVVAATGARLSGFRPLYGSDLTLMEKIEAIATSIYRAERVEAPKSVRAQLAAWEKAGFAHLPVCMAKTQYSFSTDPALLGAPEGHVLRVREVRLSAGAGFVAAICGDIMTMPGLPRRPAAEVIHLNANGQVDGLS